MENQLVEILKVNELEPTKAEIIVKQFSGFLEEARTWEAKAKSIVIKDVSQTQEMQEAREARLALKTIRVNAENKRKELKEQSLREGKAIDGISNVIKAVIVPIEEHLEKQEKFVEIQEEQRKEKINLDRISQLQPYVEDVSVYNLKEMSEAGFNQLLNGAKVALEAQKEAERKAEEERLRIAEEERKEQERIKEENEKLRKEAEAREKEIAKERAKVEAERKKAEEEQRKEREAREKAEAELKEREESEKRAKRESEEKERADEEARVKLGKVKKYKDWLRANGWTEENKDEYWIQDHGHCVEFYKLVSKYDK